VIRYTKEGLRNCIHFSLYFETVRCICLGFVRHKEVRNFASDFDGDFYTKGLQTVPKPPFFLGGPDVGRFKSPLHRANFFLDEHCVLLTGVIAPPIQQSRGTVPLRTKKQVCEPCPDRAITDRWRPFGLTLNEEQIPQIVEQKRNQSGEWNRWTESPCAQGRCATRLRYAPTRFIINDVTCCYPLGATPWLV
jgi:hypothetical protein